MKISPMPLRMGVPFTCLILGLWAGEAVAQAGPGIASKYPKDQGIAQDPKVIFVDNFESSANTADLGLRWQSISGVARMLIEAAPANVASGTRSLRITNTTGQDSGGALFKQMKPGFDTVYARYYVKFSADFQQANHFTWLMAEKDAPAWPMIQAGVIPDGAQRFSTGLEPFTWNATWDQGLPYWHFYSYWHKMTPSASGPTYGKFFDPTPAIFVQRDKWICAELMLKANSDPAINDGEHAFWIDGKLCGQWGGINWRSTNALKISGFHLSYWREPAKQDGVPVVQSEVWFDDVVLATEYIGPRMDGAAPVINSGPTAAPNPTSLK